MTVIIPPNYIAAIYFDGRDNYKFLDRYCEMTAPRNKRKLISSLTECFTQKEEQDSLENADRYLERIGFTKPTIQIFRRALKDATDAMLHDTIKHNPDAVEFNEKFHLGFRLNDKSLRENPVAFNSLRDAFLRGLEKQVSTIQHLLWTGTMPAQKTQAQSLTA